MEKRDENLGVGYLTAYLRLHHRTVAILDANVHVLNKERTLEQILLRPASLIGFSVRHEAIDNALWIIGALRKEGVDSHIVMGGYSPTLMAEQILQSNVGVDSIIRGEGERTLLELINCVLGNEKKLAVRGVSYRSGASVVHNSPRQLIADLDSVPFPARDTLPRVLEKGGIPYVVSSRGCYANCPFCCMKSFYRQCEGTAFRMRSITSVVDEIEALVQEFGIRQVFISDDNLLAPGRKGQQRARELSQEICRRGLRIEYEVVCRTDDVRRDTFQCMKDSGLKAVELGVENMASPALKRLRKRISPEDSIRAIKILDEIGVHVKANLILYDPQTTVPEIKSNLAFIRDRMGKGIVSDSVQFTYFYLFSKLIIYPGIPLEESLCEAGMLEHHGYHNTYSINDTAARRICRLGMCLGSVCTPFCLAIEELDRWATKSPACLPEHETVAALWLKLGHMIVTKFEQIVELSDTDEISGERVREFADDCHDQLADLADDIEKTAGRLRYEEHVTLLRWDWQKLGEVCYLYDLHSAERHVVDQVLIDCLQLYYRADYETQVEKLAQRYDRPSIDLARRQIAKMKQMMKSPCPQLVTYPTRNDLRTMFYGLARLSKVAFHSRYE